MSKVTKFWKGPNKLISRTTCSRKVREIESIRAGGQVGGGGGGSGRGDGIGAVEEILTDRQVETRGIRSWS